MSLPAGPRRPGLVQIAQWALTPVALLEQCARRYGPTFTLRFTGLGRWVVLSRPDHLREVFTASPTALHTGEGNVVLEPIFGPKSLLLLDEDEHARQRRVLLPPFQSDHMERYFDEMQSVTADAIAEWPVGTPFALYPSMQAITLRLILRTVFGMDHGERLERLSRLMTELLEVSSPPYMFLLPLLARFIDVTRWGRMYTLLSDIRATILEEIAARRGGGDTGRGDILSLMLQARDDEGRPLTDNELRDQLITFVAAGHETTATSLAWTFELLVRHPEAATRLQAELDAAAGRRDLRPADVPALTYLDAVIKESLRLYPVIPLIPRLVKTAMTVDGHQIPPGTTLAPCIYLAQRRPEVYPKPDLFLPERFLGRRVDPYSWLPFGGGARRCIGMFFALYEMKVVVATTLLRIRLARAPGPAATPRRRSITLAPSTGATVILDRRPDRRGAPIPLHRDTAPHRAASTP